MGLPPQIGLLRPLLLLAFSASYIPITIFRLLFPPQPKKLLSWPAFQQAWFGYFWAWFGIGAHENAKAVVVPLIRSNARGVVLDIGPGSGEWVYLYASTANKVTKVYGVEPNAEHHAALRQRIEAAGLKGVYEILPVGAQDLATVGLEKESVDTIVTVQTLCSCPGPQDIITSLYPYLKKGGLWVAFEHVKTKYTNHFVGVWQPFINLVWPIFFGGCDITRPTDEWLLKVGDWEEANMRPGEGEGKYDTLPCSFGTLVKRR